MIVADASLLAHLLIPSARFGARGRRLSERPGVERSGSLAFGTQKCPAQAHAALRDEDRARQGSGREGAAGHQRP